MVEAVLNNQVNSDNASADEMSGIRLSAYMLTHNNERTVERAIKSLGFADEIVVVDSYSTDKTVEIVQEYTDKVIQRTWHGFRDQYQFAQDQCTHDWVVFIDGDEEISEQLAQEMRDALKQNEKLSPADRVLAFRVQRRTFFLGRWILHGGWVPDRDIRLYNRQLGNWKGEIHADVSIAGNIGRLKSYCYHYSYENIEEQLRRMNNYSSRTVKLMSNAGEKFSLAAMVLSPLWRFTKEYIFKLGFLDGVPGIIIAINNCFYVFDKHAKLWEKHNCHPEKVEFEKQNRCP